MNLTEYASTWPRLKHVRTPPNPGNPWGVQPAGYLSNGRKSGTAASGDLIQLNLCANRMVKVKSCFVTAHPPADPVTLDRASIRVFDLDHGKDDGKNQHMGPEVMQFSCPGGNFQLHGSELESNTAPRGEFMVHMDDTTRALERPHDSSHVSPTGLQIHTFDCPPAGKLVTLWSSRFGKGSDNPTDTANLDQLQEQSMVIINYVNVDCFDVTLANLPAVYEEGTAQAIDDGGYAIQRLKNSEEIEEGDSTWQLDTGECPPLESGRNWLMSGLKGDGSYKCASPPPAPPSPPEFIEEVVCTNVDFVRATLDIQNLGGDQYCCVECTTDTTKLCCPSRNVDGPVRPPAYAPRRRARACTIAHPPLVPLPPTSGTVVVHPPLFPFIHSTLWKSTKMSTSTQTCAKPTFQSCSAPRRISKWMGSRRTPMPARPRS